MAPDSQLISYTGGDDFTTMGNFISIGKLPVVTAK